MTPVANDYRFNMKQRAALCGYRVSSLRARQCRTCGRRVPARMREHAETDSPVAFAI